ncbi:MAG: GspH/FimT family pseudopilin [Desulfuromonas sp.]|nr:GspH/FimT family pseudopilin [Desulfuromonas sp.]
MAKPHAQSGFTLLEIIIVLAILAISAAILAPSIRDWLPSYQINGAARELFSNMQKAKSEAVKLNTNIGISFETVVFPATGGSYTAFVDDGSGGGTAGNAVQDGTESFLFKVEMPTSCSLISASFRATKNTGYNSRGLVLGNRIGTAIIRNTRNRWQKMTLSNSGYPKLQVSTDTTDGTDGTWN